MLHRLRYPVLTADGQTGPHVCVAILSGWMCCSARVFHGRHKCEVRHAARPREKKGRLDMSLQRAMVWNVWMVLCTIISAPVTLYAAVKAVPGFLGFAGALEWIVTHTVSMLAAMLTAVVLPALAG
eukprot:4999243-Amphidinium_carterae.1